MKRLSIVDLEESYKNTPGAMIINAMSDADGRTIEDHVKLVLTDISKEIGFSASCECGYYTGNALEGHVCMYCGSVVSSKFATELANTQWLAIPEELPPFVHPVFYSMFCEVIGKTTTIRQSKTVKVPIIQIVLDPSCNIPDHLQGLIHGQGFGYFQEHYLEIFDYYYALAEKAKNTKAGRSKKIKMDALKYLLELYKDRIFTRYIPILHSSLHPLGTEGRMKCVDKGTTLIIPAIIDLSTLVHNNKKMMTSPRNVTRMLWGIYANYIEYTNNIIVKKLGEKEAHFRKHSIGSRVHSSARAVITPIVVDHEADELHVPMKILIRAYEWSIKNLLKERYGYSDDEARNKILCSLTRFDEVIYEVLETLKKESGYKGFPTNLGRNPTLGLGSLFLLFITKIKKDIRDNTISLSPRICPPLNAYTKCI